MTRWVKTIAACMMLSAMFVNAGGCRLFRTRDPLPAPGPEIPPIPEGIRQESGMEPVLRVYMADTGTVQEMGIEEYIAGVVAAEMEPVWPLEALSAQAVIARSFTLQKIAEQGGVPQRNAHASTDVEEFQAYNADRVNEKVLQAVERTRGEVLIHEGEYIRGWFHAFAGPRTALADEGLDFKGGNPPYIHIVESPGQEIVPEEEGSWQASFPLDTVRSKVTELSGKDPGAITTAKISKKGPSGRAVRISFNDVEVSAPALRLALGSTVMRSTFIQSMTIENSVLNMAGVGYGHGVGMCQWGARALAEEGRSWREIVEYFYRHVQPVKMWE